MTDVAGVEAALRAEVRSDLVELCWNMAFMLSANLAPGRSLTELTVRVIGSMLSTVDCVVD